MAKGGGERRCGDGHPWQTSPRCYISEWPNVSLIVAMAFQASVARQNKRVSGTHRASEASEESNCPLTGIHWTNKQ